jgi:hypothetical protein
VCSTDDNTDQSAERRRRRLTGVVLVPAHPVVLAADVATLAEGDPLPRLDMRFTDLIGSRSNGSTELFSSTSMTENLEVARCFYPATEPDFRVRRPHLDLN